MFAVFDGHGHVGEKCARFAMQQLPAAICAVSDKFTADAPIRSNLSKTFIEVNKKMHAAPDIDDTLSGTTGVVSIVIGNTLWYVIVIKYISNIFPSSYFNQIIQINNTYQANRIHIYIQ
jgi:serine/threonine protein phosphatase PrpC